MIGVKALVREALGAKVFVCLYDDRFNDVGQSILGSYELDMNSKEGIVYFTPDFLLPTSTFHKKIKIGIKSRGYKMKKGEKNLLVCTRFLGLAVSESNTHYRLTNDQIVKLLGAKGIKALPAKKFNSEDNAALDWILGDFLGQKRLAPQDNLLY